MRDLYLKSLTVTDDEGRAHECDYYITVDETEAGRFFCESYGIRVEERGGDAAAVRSVTCSIDRIRELGELVLRGEVTPVSLADVVEDWL